MNRMFKTRRYLLNNLNSDEENKIREMIVREVKLVLNQRSDLPVLHSISKISATSKSQVYILRLGNKKVVAKRFEFISDYNQEVQAYLLFRGGPIVKLKHVLNNIQTIILEHCEFPIYTHSKESLLRVVCALGSLHFAAKTNLLTISDYEDKVISFKNLIKFSKNPDERRALQTCADIWGFNHIPLSVGDIKAEHLLVSSKKCVFIDLETTTISKPELFDLISLKNLYPNADFGDYIWDDELSETYLKSMRLSATPNSLTNAIKRHEHLNAIA